MLIRKPYPGQILPSEITAEAVYLQRREFLEQARNVLLASWAGKILTRRCFQSCQESNLMQTTKALN